MYSNLILLVFKKKTELHMIRIRFGTFSVDRITKSLKANLEYKLSHFGGTAGLFNGFSIISVFEFLAFGVSLLILLYKFSFGKNQQSNVTKVKEFQPQKKNNEANLCNFGQKFEALERELVEYSYQMVEHKRRFEVMKKKINEKIEKETT